MMRILLVDDDRDLVEVLSFSIRRAGLDVIAAYDQPTALKIIDSEHPDLAVLDVNLGTWNGFELLKAIRQKSAIPVIMLTARGAEDDKLLGFELGAHDYVTKPFSNRELIARIRVHLKSDDSNGETSPPPTSVTIHVGPLTMNVAEHWVEKDGQPIELSVTEFRLLHYLMINANAVVSTADILKQVWGYDDPTATEVVRVAVYRLRRKLEENASEPRLIRTVAGVGPMLEP